MITLFDLKYQQFEKCFSDALSRLYTEADQDVHNVIPLNFLHHLNESHFTTVANILHRAYTNINQSNKNTWLQIPREDALQKCETPLEIIWLQY